MQEYEQSYRCYLHQNPHLVSFLTQRCGNVYDYDIENTRGASAVRKTVRNHYQDVVVRQIVAEFVSDEAWRQVIDTGEEESELIDLSTGESHVVPRAKGFRGGYLLQIRGPRSPGFFLSPAVVPVHDASLCVPNSSEGHPWYFSEGCGALSVEAFWQSSKVIEVRYDKYLELRDRRDSVFAQLP